MLAQFLATKLVQNLLHPWNKFKLAFQYMPWMMLHFNTPFVRWLQTRIAAAVSENAIVLSFKSRGLGLQVVKYLAAKYEELGCEVKWMCKPDKVI
ncbi:hypothetical protein RchiOBHm_Chr2g0145031 [Rosa chinensis]|uniref:Uncharacterized protein n=1 Tax=Rosa chinensis TaxID=74649 RepID=A0A2P6RYL1_ROSCH|nr:hypothetical protein RchiOBHm_Chr2g0145031 [Rosa chinensis]